MLEEFRTQIKPLNDELGRALRIKKVPVTRYSITREIPVRVRRYAGGGQYIYVSSKSIRSLTALGLLAEEVK